MENHTNVTTVLLPASAAEATRVLPSLPLLFLSAYPGPRLASLTDAVFGYHFLCGTSVQWIDAQHRRYGPIVRLGPTRLGYTSPEAIKDILGHRTGNHKANPKNMLFTQPAGLFDGAHSVLNEQHDALHGRQRKLFTNAFSDRALGEQENMIQGGAPVDAVKLWNFATFDIMADLTFGESLGNLDGNEYHPWAAAMFAGFKAGLVFGYLTNWPGTTLILNLLTPKAAKEEAMIHVTNSNASVTKRLERSATKRPDIRGLVMEKQKRGNMQMSRGEMNANSNLFMMAGTETTATALCGLTALLVKNPGKYEKLVEEVRAVGSKEELTGLKLRHMKYLVAVIEEGLRVYPPVPAPNLRDTPPGGNHILGDWLPEKTTIGISNYSAFHSPLNFHDPDAFVPERWTLGDEEYREYHEFDKREVFQPFSTGPRNCLGKNLAYCELLAHVVWHFDIELCPESEEWLNGQKSWQLWDKPELMVRFTERK